MVDPASDTLPDAVFAPSTLLDAAVVAEPVGGGGPAGGELALKVAVTYLSSLKVTLHVPVPAQAPLQPANVEPAAGFAVRTTGVPLS